MIGRLPGSFFLALCCLALPVSGGLVITSETREIKAGGSSETIVFHLGEGRIRLDSGALENGRPAMSVMYDEKTRSMVNIDHRASSYKEFTEMNIAQFSRRVEALQRRVDSKLEELDPERRVLARELLEKRLGAGQPAPAEKELIKTGESRRIGNFECSKYEVKNGASTRRELWVAGWDELGVVKGTFTVFGSMATFYKKVVHALSFWAQAKPESDPLGDFESLDGFPILIRHFRNGEVVRETTFKSFEQRELKAEHFQPPDHYEQQAPFPQSQGG